MSNTYAHSGDIGDILYALPVIKAMGGGHLRLIDTPGRTSHGMNLAKAERLATLLRIQPYIESCEFSVIHNSTSIDGFRDHDCCGNLVDMHLATHGLNWRARIDPWISVDEASSPFEVIIHRSDRYHGRFPWADMLKAYEGRIGFVGFPDEHARFTAEFGNLPFVDAPDYLSLARIIAGSKWFAGNQSSPLAVAHGMKHNVMMEISPGPAQQHCVFQRSNNIIVWDEKVEWPKLT